MPSSHESLVAAQFGAQAAAYVLSADHARGDDLQHLAAIASTRRPARALDCGCGGGHVTFALAPLAGSVVAFDPAPEMLAAMRGIAAGRGLTNITTERGSVEALPFSDASFDLIATRYSAHHWPNLAAGLAEMRRVLKPGGIVVAMDVVSPGDALGDTFLQAIELLRDPTHVRDYAPAEWAAALDAAGLRPRARRPARLRLAFDAWVKRSATPPDQIRAVRALQARMPPPVARHFAVEADGSFTLDTMMFEATLDDAMRAEAAL